MTAQNTYGRIGELLKALSDEIEKLGAALCLDEDICARHFETLQQIDRIAQTQRAIAAILGAAEVDSAVATIPLDHVRHALTGIDRASI